MRTPSKAPAATPPRGKRPSAVGAVARPLKKPPPKRAVFDDDVAQDDAPELTLTDIEAADERGADSIETLPELERAIGIADWIDPQTGEPAEGQSPPHLEEE